MRSFVSSFMVGIMADEELECHHEKFQDAYEMELLQEKLHQFFKTLLDGQRFYIGKDMYEVHKELGITDHLFDKAGSILAQTAARVTPTPSPHVQKVFNDRVTALRNVIVI